MLHCELLYPYTVCIGGLAWFVLVKFGGLNVLTRGVVTALKPVRAEQVRRPE